MSRTEEVYRPALSGRKIPILVLDNKWHQLFTQGQKYPEIQKLEGQLNELLKKQGKLNTEVKDIKKLKKKLMKEIVDLMDGMQETELSKEQEKKLDEHKRLINDCNDKLDAYQEDLLDIPKEIQEVNYDLMLQTMEVCYSNLKENTTEIEEITEWVKSIRVELKKKLVHKQEKEIMNQTLYAYMHDIFGADVIEIFDMKYNPAENPITKKEK